MSGEVPWGTTVLAAHGRKPRRHVSTERLDKAIEWLMRLRVLQADGLSFDDALEQANREADARAHPVAGRKHRKNGV